MKKFLIVVFGATLGLFGAAQASDRATIINDTGVSITISYKHNGINTTTQTIAQGNRIEVPLKNLTIKVADGTSNWYTKLIITGTPKAKTFKIQKGKTWNSMPCLNIDDQYNGLELKEN